MFAPFQITSQVGSPASRGRSHMSGLSCRFHPSGGHGSTQWFEHHGGRHDSDHYLKPNDEPTLRQKEGPHVQVGMELIAN
eukprot:354212-Chlamydomonas_euryale.AAC.11